MSGVRAHSDSCVSNYIERDFLANSILLPDGNEIMTVPNAQAHWDADSVGGRRQWAADGAALEKAQPGDAGIFTVWSIPKRPKFSANLPFTAEAVAARAEWDMIDNPYTRCEQPGMPRVMLNPHPFEFIDNGETITVFGEEFDIVRTIYKSPADSARLDYHPSIVDPATFTKPATLSRYWLALGETVEPFDC